MQTCCSTPNKRGRHQEHHEAGRGDPEDHRQHNKRPAKYARNSASSWAVHTPLVPAIVLWVVHPLLPSSPTFSCYECISILMGSLYASENGRVSPFVNASGVSSLLRTSNHYTQ